MGAFSQLRLNLWKHVTIRKRQPITLILEFLWPVVVFILIVNVRHMFPPEPKGDCVYKARALPSAGLLPFTQSFVCNLDNKCSNLSSYEEIPAYEGSKIGPLVNKFYPLIQRPDAQAVLDELSTTMALASHVVKSLDKPAPRKVLGKAIQVRDLFKDPKALEGFLVGSLKKDAKIVGHLFQAEIDIGQLLRFLPSIGPTQIACQPEVLSQVLHLPAGSDAEATSLLLCSMVRSLTPSLIQKLISQVDVQGLLGKVAILLDAVGSNDIAEALTGGVDVLDAVLSIPILGSLAKAPINAETKELTDYLQSALQFLSTLKGLDIDLNFIGEMMDDIEYIVGPNEFISHVKAIGKHVHRLIVWSQTGVLESPSSGSAQLTVSDILNDRETFSEFLKNKTSLSDKDVDILMTVKVKSAMRGNSDFCSKLCDEMTVENVIDFEGTVDMSSVMQLWTLTCTPKNCQTFIKEDFSEARSMATPSMTVDSIADELRDLLAHTSYLGNKVGGTLKKAFPAFDVLWKLTTTALSIAFLPEWDFNNSSFINGLASTLETLPGYLPEQMQLPVLNLVTAADVTFTVAVIIAKKAAEVDHTLYGKLLNDPKNLEKTLSFGPDVMTGLAALFTERSTLEMLMERPGQLKSLVCNATLARTLLVRASEDDVRVLHEFLCSLPLSEMTDGFTSSGDRELLVQTVEEILVANDQEDIDTAFAHRVRSLCLRIWELVQVVRNSTKDTQNWDKFLEQLHVDGQNFLEKPWVTARDKLEGVKYGSILNVYTSVLGRSLDKKKFSGRAEKVMTQVGVMINAITEEALSIPESFLRDLAKYWPSVISVFLESLGDPQKTRAVVSTRTWSGVVCNETLRNERLAIPGSLDNLEFTEFFCNLTNFVEVDIFAVNWFEKPFVKTIQQLTEGKMRPGKKKVKMNWTESLKGVKTMLGRYGRFVARSLDHEDEVSRLTERAKTVFGQLNVTNILKFSLNVGTVVMEFVDRQLATVQPWVWKHIKALISSLDLLVQHVNKELNKILVENKVETGVMTFNLPILTTMMRKVIRLFPDFMHVFADLLTTRLGDFIGRVFQVVRKAPMPCDGLSLTDLVDFSPTGNRLARDMERYACDQWRNILGEVIQYPLMFKLIWKFREASKDQDLFVNWTSTADNAQQLVDYADELTRFTGAIFPDVEGFTVENADVAINRFVNAIMLNTTERGLKFLLLIGDALVPLFENLLKTGELSNVSSVSELLQSIHNESFTEEQLGEVAWFTFKTVMKTVDVVLSDAVTFFESFKDDNVTLSSIFGPIMLTRVFEAFPDYVNSIAHSLLRPELPQILDELRVNGSLSFGDLCEKRDLLERLVVTPDYLRDVNRTVVLDTACRLLSQPFHYFALEPYIYSWAIKTFDKVVMLWKEQNPRNTIVHFVDIIEGIEFMSFHVQAIVGNATATARYFQDLVNGDRWEIVGRGMLEAVVNAQLKSWTDFRNADLSAIESIGPGPIAQLLKVAGVTMEAVGQALMQVTKPGAEVTLPDMLSDHLQLMTFTVFVENHFMDVLQLTANTLVFEPQKLKPLLQSPSWQAEICAAPLSEYFSSKAMNPALMESLKEEFCALDLNALLRNGSVTNDTSDSGIIDAEGFAALSETFVQFLQRVARFHSQFPESRIVSPLLGHSVWEDAVREIKLEPGTESSAEGGHTRAVTARMIDNLLKMDDEGASISKALHSMDTFVTANLKTVQFMRMHINESLWKTLRMWYQGKTQVQTLINIIQDIPNLTASIIQTFLDPVKFRVLLEKLATLTKGSTLGEFCQDLNLNQYFHVSGTAATSFADLQLFICTTDWKQFAKDIIPAPSGPDTTGTDFSLLSFAEKVAELHENIVNVTDVGLPYIAANYTDLPWIREEDWKSVVAAIDSFKDKMSNRSLLIDTAIQYVSLVDLIPDWSQAEGFLQLVNSQMDVVLRQLNVTKAHGGQQKKLYDIITDVALLNEAVDQIHTGVKMASDLAVHYAFVRQLKYFETFPNATSHFCASSPPTNTDVAVLQKDGVDLGRLFARFCTTPPAQWIRIMTDEFRVSKHNVKSVVDQIMLVLPPTSPWFTDSQWRRSVPFDWAVFTRSVHFLDDLCHDPPSDFYPGFVWAAWKPAFKAFGEVLPKMIALSGETVCPTMPWLNYAPFTGLIEVVHKQVLLAEEYERLLCDFPRMNLSSIYHRLKNDLDLVETLKQLRVHITAVSLTRIHEPTGQSLTCPAMFNATSGLADSLNDLVVDYVESDTRIQKIKDCFQEDTQAEVISEIDKYLKLVSKAMPLLNIPNITAISNSNDLVPLVVTVLNYVKEQVPVFVPTKSVLKPGYLLTTNNSADPAWVAFIEGSININRLFATHFDPARISAIFCNSTKLTKFSVPPNGVFVEPVASELSQTFCESGDSEAVAPFAMAFLDAVDEIKVRSMLPTLQMQTLLSWNLVMAVGRRIGSLSSALFDIKDSLGNLDFDALTSNITLRSLVETLLPLVYADNLTSMAHGLDVIAEDLVPLIYGSYFEENLQQLGKGVHAMYRFIDKVLRNDTIAIRSLVIDNGEIQAFLLSKGVPQDIVERGMNMKLNISMLLFDIKLTKLENLICDVEIMERVFDLYLDWGKISNAVGKALCSDGASAASQLFDIMFENANFEGIIKHDLQFILAGIAAKAGVRVDDAIKAVLSLLGARELVPIIMGELKALQEDTSLLDMLKQLDPEKLAKGEISGSLISVTGNLVCGHQIRSFDEYFRLLTSPSDRPPEAKDKMEMNALPTKFCQTLYQQIAYRPAGSVIWGFVKPLLKGRILFTPDNPASRRIMMEANRTFDGLATGIDMITRWSKGFSRLGDFANNQLVQMEEVLSLPLAKSVVVGLVGPEVSSSLFNLSSTLENMGNPQRFLVAANALGEGLQCFETNRIIGYSSEEELEKAATGFHKQGIFMAGIVFTNLLNEPRSKRDAANDSESDAHWDLPTHVQYKLRMDIDDVPTTKMIKSRFWRPGPDDNFIEHMRYMRGFVEMQDMVDHAIIRNHLKGREDVKLPGVLLQQFPYPCYQSDDFGYLLRYNLPAIIALAWIFIIAFFVRELVLDREMMLEQIMRVMGMRAWVNWLSWFIKCFVVMLVTNIICVVFLKYGGIFPNSDITLLFVFFFLFAISTIMFCYLVSIWFKTATVAAITAVLLYLTTYFTFIIITTLETRLEFWPKMLMNLLMSTSFSQGCVYINRFEVQNQGINWYNMWQSPIPGDDMCFAWCAVMLAVDAGVYFILAAYFRALINVFHRSDRKRFSYIFWPFLQQAPHHAGRRHQLLAETDSFANLHSGMKDGSIPVNDSMMPNGRDVCKIGISLQNLRKVYHAGESDEKVAVEGLCLDFFEGQITSMLGQNGAGKTTTINMLTGQFPPHSGWATIYGHDVVYEFDEIRKNLGICPQYNVLFDLLTVREHLEFYARLKGILSSKRLQEDVNAMLSSMGLEERQHETVQKLSGGMRRRLCVAIAFVGGSQTIILDEPTSGVDPVARRHIWNLIMKYKQGRTILLTTHNLDEADILSDRVAIIHEGKLLCCGSPLRLKRSFGSGYQLTISKTSPDFGSDTDSGAISTSSGSDSQTNCNAASIFSFIRSYVSNVHLVEDHGNEMVFCLPYCGDEGNVHTLDQFFLDLEKHQGRLGIGSYGLSCTTLEEVFMNVCLQAEANIPITPQGHKIMMMAKKVQMANKGIIDKDPIGKESPVEPVMPSVNNVLKKQESLVGVDAWLNKSLYHVHYQHLTGMALKWSQFKWLLVKRFHHFRRDWRALITCIFLPCVFVAIAMALTLIRPEVYPYSPPLKLDPSIYGPHGNSFFVSDANGGFYTEDLLGAGVGVACLADGVDGDEMDYPCIYPSGQTVPPPIMISTQKDRCTCTTPDDRKCDGSSVNFDTLRYIANSTDILYNISRSQVSEWLVATNAEFIEQRYGGWSFGVKRRPNGLPGSDDNVISWYNNKGYHALPSYLNSANNLLLRTSIRTNDSNAFTQYGISTYSHPLHLSKTQLGMDSLLHHISDVGIALVFLISFSFIPAGFVIYLVKERVQEEKRLQYVSGVGPLLYWTSSLFFDMLVLCIPVALSAVIIAIFDLPIYMYGHNFAATLVMLYMFGWATTPLMYIAEKFFDEPSLASMVLFCANIFVGINTTICTLLLYLFQKNEAMGAAMRVLRYLFLVFPQFAFAGGLIDMTKNYIQAEIFIRFGDDTYINPFSMELLGVNFIVLAVQGAFFFIVNLMLEYTPYFTTWIEKRRNKFPSDFPAEDSDVQQERRKVLNGESQGDLMRLGNLYKVYDGMAGKNVAVDRVCLTIPNGECFGLLGINGAGKTTIFRMLTGEIMPTFGEVLFKGKSISTAISNGSQNIGYCPQANAVDELLTAEELLSIYAGLRGIPDVDIPLAVYKAVVQFNLQANARRITKTYSCGTKRKLCAAVSVMGNPDIVLMDEPTSGMDPSTRRLVWNNVRQITKEKRSVILTSHSMEECDTLCNRLAIMVNGKFQCLGSPQYLKHKFGDGYTITLRIRDQPIDWKEILVFVQTNFPGSVFRAKHCSTIEFLVARSSCSLGDIFSQLEGAKESVGIEDFSVTQTTLDQVFVNFVQDQADGPNVVDHFNGGHLNLGYSLDDDEDVESSSANGKVPQQNHDAPRKGNDYQVTQF